MVTHRVSSLKGVESENEVDSEKRGGMMKNTIYFSEMVFFVATLIVA